jgi:bifunctional DNase/RNase
MQIEMTVRGTVPDPMTHMPVIVLRESQGTRDLLIWVGKSEGDAIQMEIDGIHPPRPMTHDLLKAMISSLRGVVQRVVVSELKDNTFYASIEIRASHGVVKVDARPSDAIALAVRAGCPIFAEEAVIQSARTEEAQPESPGIGRLQRWLEGLSDDELGQYKM